MGVSPADPPIATLAEAAERVAGLAPGELGTAGADLALERLRERLAGRNLGLVRVRDPDRFAWAGHWLGVVREPGGSSRAVVLFGVPSATVETPGGPPPDPGTPLVDGYVIAPLDLGRPHGAGAYREPDGPGTGVVEGIFTAPVRDAPCLEHEEREAAPGRGLAGDRYAVGRGTFSAPGRGGQDLTLIEAEALDELAARGIRLAPAAARRNLVTRGIRLDALIGREFRVGEVRCFGARLAEPCAHLERLTEPGVLRGLVHRGGIRADVRSAGTIRRRDPVRADAARADDPPPPGSEPAGA